MPVFVNTRQELFDELETAGNLTQIRKIFIL